VVIEDEGVMPRDILVQVRGDWNQLIHCRVQWQARALRGHYEDTTPDTIEWSAAANLQPPLAIKSWWHCWDHYLRSYYELR